MMPFLMSLQRIGIDFRHHQRHVAVHAPGAGIVDHQAALGRDLGRPFLGDGAARRHQADIGALEIVIVERLDLEGAVAERDFGAHRAGRGQRHDFADRELALRQHRQHFAPDIAGRADHCDFVSHRPSFPADRPRRTLTRSAAGQILKEGGLHWKGRLFARDATAVSAWRRRRPPRR